MIDFRLGIHLEALESWTDLAKWRNDPTIWRWTRQNDLISSFDQASWFEKQSRDPSIKMYQMVDDGAVVVGVCGLTSINWMNRNAEFSLYVAPEHQGRGIGRSSLKTLFSHGFQNMGLHLIWGETFSGNPAAKLFEQIGMQKDGVRRDFYWKDGSYTDAIMYSIKREEYIKSNGGIGTCF